MVLQLRAKFWLMTLWLREERSAALVTQEAAVVPQVQHQGLLLAATRGMGLVTPGQGVQAPPNLGFDLTCNQETAPSHDDRGSTGQVPASFFRNRKNKWAEVPLHSLL